MNVIAGSQRTSTERPSLEGTLGDLQPMELLRLLASTKQTGTLQVLADGPVLVTIVDGAVSYATSDPKLTLRDVLVDEGIVDAAVWEQAIAQEDRELGDVLVELGVDEPHMLRVIRRAVLDTTTDLALAQTGRFRFATGRRHTIGARFLYPVAELALDVDEQLTRWDTVRAVVPAFTTIPRLAPTIAEGTSVTIDAADWRTLAAIDGHRTLEDVRADLGLTRFSLGCSVAALVDLGVVTFGLAD